MTEVKLIFGGGMMVVGNAYPPRNGYAENGWGQGVGRSWRKRAVPASTAAL